MTASEQVFGLRGMFTTAAVIMPLALFPIVAATIFVSVIVASALLLHRRGKGSTT